MARDRSPVQGSASAGSGWRLLMLVALAAVLFGAYYFLVRGPEPAQLEETQSGEVAGHSAVPAEGGERSKEGNPDPLSDLGEPGGGPNPEPDNDPDNAEEAEDAPQGQPVDRDEPEPDGRGRNVPRAEPSDGDDYQPTPDPLGRREEGRYSGEPSGQRLSASNYVTYAFGYTGNDVQEYRKNVEQTVLPDDFYASPGGGYVEQTAERMKETTNGVQSAAILKDFEILRQRDQDYQVLLTFDVGDTYGTTGVEGEVSRYQQEVRLSEWRRNYWKVKTAGPADAPGDAPGGAGG